MTELEAKVGEPFEHEAKLKSLAQRQDEIVTALDLTRNQASNKLDANAPADVEEGVSERVGKAVRLQVRDSHRVSV
jgi:hypothetical protein